FITQFRSLGGRITTIEIVRQGDRNLIEPMQRIAEGNVSLIYAPLLPGDMVRLLETHEAVNETAPIMGNRVLRGNWFLEQHADYRDIIVYATGPELVGEAYLELAATYEERYGVAPATQDFAYAYDATQMLLQTLQEIAVVDGDGNLYVGRQALRERLFQTILYPGTTGTFTCTTWGNCSTNPLSVARISNDAWEVIYRP
ncbi:MAG: ABC transporter substrate-binding protein, partial [Chloroflexi bacterium]|nr:ABC transporter substrate-binding protein [Chloroflexota bacterium]